MYMIVGCWNVSRVASSSSSSSLLKKPFSGVHTHLILPLATVTHIPPGLLTTHLLPIILLAAQLHKLIHHSYTFHVWDSLQTVCECGARHFGAKPSHRFVHVEEGDRYEEKSEDKNVAAMFLCSYKEVLFLPLAGNYPH